jgi:hypothetical protein
MLDHLLRSVRPLTKGGTVITPCDRSGAGSEIDQGIHAVRDDLVPDFAEALRIHGFAP